MKHLLVGAVSVLLGLILAVRAPAPKPKPADRDEEVLYPSHHCATGNWYTAAADADTVTAACDAPRGDEDKETDPE